MSMDRSLLLCPKCGADMVTGERYPSCADFPKADRPVAHFLLCQNFADDLCATCDCPTWRDATRKARPDLIMTTGVLYGRRQPCWC